MNRLISFFMAVVSFFTALFSGGKSSPYFKNEYDIPETPAEYSRIDTSPKTDWKAEYIWDASDGTEENVWMCFRKTAEIAEKPDTLTAYISADSKYWLYINGETAVFEGGVKRGPTQDGSYFDTVNIAPYLRPGVNTICALVWYWGKDTAYSYKDSGRAGFIFEAGDIVSDSSWKARRNSAFLNGPGASQPNYRLPESSIYYDARKEEGEWTFPAFDVSAWENAAECGKGGCAPWGALYPRGIPMLRDYGLKEYENSGIYTGRTILFGKKITLDIPYNAQCTPYFRIESKAGKTIRIFTENTWLGTVSDTYITKDGVQEFESPGWFNGEHITYDIPAGVKILDLRYRETGYDTAFSGLFECKDEKLNTLWQKSLRTLYVTMRDNFMDCPDRERAQWWGDVTNEMQMSMYALGADSCLLYQKGVASMLGHTDETNVLQTVVPIGSEYFELPVQQLAGICGFWTYYLYTGDREFLDTVYDASVNYVNLWTLGENSLVVHRPGSWDWMDWGSFSDETAIENAWYYWALSSLVKTAEVTGRDSSELKARMDAIRNGYGSLWTDKGYKGSGVLSPDDRANALAVLSGLAPEDKYDTITSVLVNTNNSSPYMEFYVLEALCEMARFDEARARMLRRYDGMIKEDYSTLWEYWIKANGTANHAWSGGPLVIMSKYFAGIRPLSAGYSEFIINPQIDSDDRISCVVPSVKGYIKTTGEKSGNGFVLDAEIPAQTKAYIYVPYTEGQTVKLGGSALYTDSGFTGQNGVEFAEESDGFAVFSVTAPEKTNLHFEVLNQN